MPDIDFVVLWVDGNDPTWKKTYSHFKSISTGVDESSIIQARFRDMGIFKYWFRGVENYAPWVRKIHLVTCGQLPSFLNINHDKLNIVNHTDIMDEKTLPTFSSQAIEVNIHKIKGLSDKFVFFNDDMILNYKISPDFYFLNGLPNDFFIESKIRPTLINDIVFNSVLMTNVSVINNFFSRDQVISKNITKYYSIKYGKYLFRNIKSRRKKFNGFLGKHLPQPFLRSTFEEVCGLKEIKVLLDRTTHFKFREGCTLNQYIFRYWQLAKGDFNPCNPEKIGVRYNLNGDRKQLLNAINHLISNEPQICLNDCFPSEETFDYACNKISKILASKLDVKSSFEL